MEEGGCQIVEENNDQVGTTLVRFPKPLASGTDIQKDVSWDNPTREASTRINDSFCKSGMCLFTKIFTVQVAWSTFT